MNATDIMIGVIIDIFFDHYLAKNWSDILSNSILKIIPMPSILFLLKRLQNFQKNHKQFIHYMIELQHLI